MRRYRLIAADMDGTLFDQSRTVPSRTLEAIRAIQRRQVAFVLATGRMCRSTLPYAEALAITTPMICYHGAMIVTPDGARQLTHRRLDPHLARSIAMTLESMGFHINVYVNDVLYVPEYNARVAAYTDLAQVEAFVPACWQRFWDSISHEDPANHPTKLVAIASPEQVAHAEGSLRAIWQGQVWLHSSQPNFLEVCHPLAGKGQALAWVAKQLGVPLSETVAIGDGCNDHDMLASAGLAVAMGNAHPSLKAIAHCVTGHVKEAGAATVLEWLLASDRLAQAPAPRDARG